MCEEGERPNAHSKIIFTATGFIVNDKGGPSRSTQIRCRMPFCDGAHVHSLIVVYIRRPLKSRRQSIVVCLVRALLVVHPPYVQRLSVGIYRRHGLSRVRQKLHIGAWSTVMALEGLQLTSPHSHQRYRLPSPHGHQR